MRKIFFPLIILVSFTSPLMAQQEAAVFQIPVNYLVYLPSDYEADTAKKWPLMLFLHGAGERGDDLQKVKVHGPPKLIEQGKKFPFIVISPQAPVNEGWEPQVIIRLLKGIQTKYRVDKERIYLTGLSMGGFGTWAIAKKFPSVFAAIVPICGGGDTAELWKLRNTPVWCFHGAKDDVVKPEQSYRMVNALKKYNNNIKLTVYPDANHDSWTPTYNNDSLYTWLLQQKKFRFPRKSMDAKELEKYAGGYAQAGEQTLHLIVKDGKLVVKEEPSVKVIPSGKDLFFATVPDEELEVKFHRNKQGHITGFSLYQDTIMEFRKVK